MIAPGADASSPGARASSPGARAIAPDLLVVSYGEPEALAPLLESVARQVLRPARFRIWHNGPRFGEVLAPGWEALRASWNALGADGRDLELLSSGENLGFGEGVNRLFAAADPSPSLRAPSPFAVIANPDLVLDPQCLLRFAAELSSHPGAAVVGGALADSANPARVNAYGQRLTPDLIGVNTDRGEPFLEFLTRADASREQAQRRYLGPSGALFAVARGPLLARAPGPLFARSFFLYLEDVALWLRLRAAGAEVRFCPAAWAVHGFSKSSGARSATKLYYLERNRLWVSRVLLGDLRAAALLSFTMARYAAYLAAGRERPPAPDAAAWNAPARNAPARNAPARNASAPDAPAPEAPGDGPAALARAFSRALREGLFAEVPYDVRAYLAGARALWPLRGFRASLGEALRNPVG